MGILLTLRMLRFASLIINRGVELGQIAMVFLSIIPTFLEVALPLATLLGIMLAFGRLSGDSEIIVMRSSGVSILQTIRPVLVFGLFSAIATLLVCLYLSPYGFQKLSTTLFEIARSRSLAGLDAGVFNKLGGLTLYSEEIDYRTGHLKHVMVDDRRVRDNRRIITADQGFIRSDEQARSITIYLKDGYIHEQLKGRYVLTQYKTNNLSYDSDDLFDRDKAKQGKSPREYFLGEFENVIADYRRQIDEIKAGAAAEQLPETPAASLPALKKAPTVIELERKIRRLQTERGRRFSMPFAAIVLALVALPIGIQVPRTQRTWGVGLSAALGMAVFVLYYGLLSVGVTFAETGGISPHLGLWLPNLITLALAIYATRQVGLERWHSIPHAVEMFLARVSARLRGGAAA